MHHIFLIFCLINVCFLYLLENIGFLFRIAGFDEDNVVAGYSFQTTFSFGARIFTLFFTPIFAYLADTKNINIFYYDILIYYLALYSFILFSIKKVDKIVNVLRIIISSQLAGKSVLKATFQKKVIVNFIKIIFPIRIPRNLRIKFDNHPITNQLGEKRILNNFSLTYVPCYSCWIIISLLIVIFPDKPSFIISLSTFFTLLATIYQSLYFDPWISRHVKNKEFSRSVYLQLQFLKLRSVLISFLISSLIYLITFAR